MHAQTLRHFQLSVHPREDGGFPLIALSGGAGTRSSMSPRRVPHFSFTSHGTAGASSSSIWPSGALSEKGSKVRPMLAVLSSRCLDDVLMVAHHLVRDAIRRVDLQQ